MRCEVRARGGQECVQEKELCYKRKVTAKEREEEGFGLEVWEADREKETKTGREERMRREREGGS